jgi:hypothetical protein
VGAMAISSCIQVQAGICGQRTHGIQARPLYCRATVNLTIFSTNSGVLWSSGTSTTPTSGAVLGQAPFHQLFADNATHTYYSTESNAAQKADWKWRFDGPGAESQYEPTDLSVYNENATLANVYWSQEPGVGTADVICTVPHPSDSTRCSKWRIRFDDGFATSGSSHMKTNAVCHEFGHTVGFRDSFPVLLNQSSCMTGGDNSRTAWWERNSINSKY